MVSPCGNGSFRQRHFRWVLRLMTSALPLSHSYMGHEAGLEPAPHVEQPTDREVSPPWFQLGSTKFKADVDVEVLRFDGVEFGQVADESLDVGKPFSRKSRFVVGFCAAMTVVVVNVGAVKTRTGDVRRSRDQAGLSMSMKRASMKRPTRTSARPRGPKRSLA